VGQAFFMARHMQHKPETGDSVVDRSAK